MEWRRCAARSPLDAETCAAVRPRLLARLHAHAATRCITPALLYAPWIALTERSIASHSRPISVAACDCASNSRTPSPEASESAKFARLVIWPDQTGTLRLAIIWRA